MTYQIHNIFPTPLLSHKNFLPKEYLDQVIDCAMKQEYKSGHIDPNKVKSSVTKNFLKNLPWFKEEILETFKEYAYNILKIDMNVGFQIGSSWTTLTNPNKDSKSHTHANYYYSGCFYLSENPTPIEFHLGSSLYNYHEKFYFSYSEKNVYNTNIIAYEPEQNEIIFFPSYLKHAISLNTSDQDRYSLAFNIHPVGIYGNLDSTIHIEIIDDLD
jgi:uncharacterized protein (TIGR02466 family)